MEGFLFKKGKGDSSFGRRSWKKRWFILEDNLLSYYEDLDLETGIPFSQKGVRDVSGCEIIPVSEPDRKFSFVIKHSNKSALYLQADDLKIMNIWIKALMLAASGETKKVDYEACYSKLGLQPENNPSASDVNRAYRKAALKVHPDKGGDMAEFKKLQEAFEHLTSRLEENEINEQFNVITFEAVIQKGGQGVGLGMVVIEDAKKGTIKVKKVMPDMILTHLSDGAGGAIRPGDILIKVGKEDVSAMPMTRVVQKISDLRVPVNTSVKLTFSRRVHKDGTPEEVNFDNAPVFTPQSTSVGGDAPGSTSNNNSSSSYNFNDSPPHETPSSPNAPSHMGWSGSPASHLDPVQYVSALAENEELKSDLETALQQLNQAYQVRDKLVTENRKLKNEVSRSRVLLAESLKRQYLLEIQAQQNCVYGVMGADQLEQALQDALSVAARLTSAQPLSVSPELSRYMDGVGLSASEAREDKLKSSLRAAVSASASADRSGLMVQKWDVAGDSALLKLNRFEEVVSKLERSRPHSSCALFRPSAAPNKIAAAQSATDTISTNPGVVVESRSFSHYSNEGSDGGPLLTLSATTNNVLSPKGAAGRFQVSRTAGEGGAALSSITASKVGGEPGLRPMLVFPKRQTPAVPLTRSASTFK